MLTHLVTYMLGQSTWGEVDLYHELDDRVMNSQVSWGRDRKRWLPFRQVTRVLNTLVSCTGERGI